MLKQFTTALSKAVSFVSTSIEKIKGLTKPCSKFFTWLFERWWMLPVRYNFLNLSRYGGYSEKAIREQFKRRFPFPSLFHEVFESLSKKECIAAFDPSYIPKSGKKTYGMGRFWSGTDSRMKKGLEVSSLAIIDVADGTAYSLEAVQTPADPDNLVEHYAKVITERIDDILPYTCYVAVDGYFMKEGFIRTMLDLGLQVITKGRTDSDMLYLYNGRQHKGKGRKKKFAGKIDWKHNDRRRWKVCYEDEEMIAYELVVWSKVLGRAVKAVYLWHKVSEGYAILISTDTELKGETVLKYYRLRFQIEFLIRDAKSYTGLEHCQGRNEVKLYNHFNMALMSVSIIKWLMWAKLPNKEEVSFSMRSVKTYFMNKFLTQTIFSKLGLELSCKKIKKLFNECLNIGSMAA